VQPGAGDPGQERRRAERLRHHARAWCEAQGITLYGRIGNVSQSGLFLLSSAPLQPGTRVKVAIPVDTAAPARDFVADAEVVWARGSGDAEEAAPATERGASGLALRFLEITAEALELLRALLQGGRPA
jgi:hypothetical protein